MAKRSQLPKSSGASRDAASSASRSSSSRWLLLGLIAAVVVVAVGLILLMTQAARKPIEATNRVGEGTAWGAATAPVQIVAFSDYGCSHCRDFALNQGHQLRAEYENTGKVRFEAKTFVLNWQTTGIPPTLRSVRLTRDVSGTITTCSSVSRASVPSRSAGRPSSSMRCSLGLTRRSSTSASITTSIRISWRGTARMGGAGVNATPTFFVNGKKIEGALPYADFKAVVDAAIAAAG